jgi:hypothetical protein
MGQLGRVASWFGVVAGLALIPIYAFYFLLEKQGIETRWTDYLPVSDSRLKDEVVWLLKNINDALIVFFRGQVLVAICDGVLYAIGFLLIGLPYAMLLGMAAAVLTIVPFLGAIVTCGAALVIAMVQFGDWQHPLWVSGGLRDRSGDRRLGDPAEDHWGPGRIASTDHHYCVAGGHNFDGGNFGRAAGDSDDCGHPGPDVSLYLACAGGSGVRAGRVQRLRGGREGQIAQRKAVDISQPKVKPASAR